MSKMVDYEAVLEAVMKHGKKIPTYAIRVKHEIEALPTIEVVRCKDCKHNMDNGMDYRDNTPWCCMCVNPEGFCERGERREDEHDKP